MEVTEELKNKLGKLSHEQLVDLSIKLTMQLNKLQILHWSRGRERSIDYSGMKCLFDEIEVEASKPEDSDVGSPDTEKKSPDSKPVSKERRKSLPIWLPREIIEIDLPEDQKICPHHQSPLVRIGSKSIEKLEIVPAKALVKEFVTFTYKCTCCDSHFEESKREPDVLPKSFASPSLLAHIVAGKFIDGMPLYRQERIFDRLGIELNRTTMARWLIKLAEKLRPLMNLMQEDLLGSSVIHADETEIQVLDEPHKKAQTKSYMWVVGRRGAEPIIFFHYHPQRSTSAALQVLADYTGIIVADGYKVYESLERKLGFKLAACMAHIRRKFWEAEKVAKREIKKGTPILASEALALIKHLYAIEDEILDEPPDRRILLRQEKSKSIMNAFKSWLDDKESRVLPSSPTGKAISYALGQWPKMLVFLDNPDVALDNNFLESALRPFVVGRNAWLFSQSVAGAESSAAFYSLVETAKRNLIDPYEYLELVFKELPRCQTVDDFTRLLPYQASKHFPLKPYQLSK